MNWREEAIDRLIEQGLLPPSVKDDIPQPQPPKPTEEEE